MTASNPKKPAPVTGQSAQPDLQKQPIESVMSALAATPDGLSGQEASNRLTKYGPNEIPEPKPNLLLKFLSYFWGPIPWMVEVAVILSFLARHWADFAIILVLLLVNAVVGFWEEFQAGNAVAALKARLAVRARVRRDGQWGSPPVREIVPGDIIRLRMGDIIPADARLLDGDSLQIDQSALTGESLPVEKKPGDAVFSGSIVRQGEINALVYATGIKTYYGKTAQLVASARTVSHFQRAVLRIGNFLIIIAAVLVTLIVIVSIARHDPLVATLQFALVLTVASIPVAMPTVLSVTMAIGARLLAARDAIVSRLVSIEELAGVDVLCADKTGTLTQNKLSLGEPFAAPEVQPDYVILNAALASRSEDADTIDQAILAGLTDESTLQGFTTQHFQPFDPVHKRTEATVQAADGNVFKVTKGAAQVIIQLCQPTPEVTQQTEQAIAGFAAKGYRSLGVARAEGNEDWKFLGILPLFDPPREDAAATIKAARDLGVRVKMVTGDQLAIAKETAARLELGSDIYDAGSFGHEPGKEADAADDLIDQADGFAQVYPEHKFHIVEVLQAKGHFVGMTGDGVNDAPALKKADCGIAVSGATDSARAAASIVLLKPGLSVIIAAIRESRMIFQRMTAYSLYRISETVRVILFMTLSILVFNFYPLTAVMIVLLALLNDGAILTISYDHAIPDPKPVAWNMPLVLKISTVLGVAGVIASFGMFFLGERVFHLDRAMLQTLMYLKLSLSGHLQIFITRTRGPFWSVPPARILVAAVLGTQVLATFISVYGLLMTPMGWNWALFVWGYVLIWWLINDRIKLLAYHIFAK